MDPNKSLGYDDFGPLFYQKYWHIIGKEVIIAVHRIFHHGKITHLLNHMLITLIPKCDCLEALDQFRPISVGNSIYKAIAKIIVHIMSPIMKKVISPF